MALLYDALLGFAISMSFAVGGLLYLTAREEIDPIVNRFRGNRFAFLKESALAPLGILGLIFALATVSPHIKIISLAYLVGGLLFGSFLLCDKDPRVVAKYSLETVVSFFGFYMFLIVLMNL